MSENNENKTEFKEYEGRQHLDPVTLNILEVLFKAKQKFAKDKAVTDAMNDLRYEVIGVFLEKARWSDDPRFSRAVLARAKYLSAKYPIEGQQELPLKE